MRERRLTILTGGTNEVWRAVTFVLLQIVIEDARAEIATLVAVDVRGTILRCSKKVSFQRGKNNKREKL